jgi:hypothetical protein
VSQRRIWADPDVRKTHQARAEAIMKRRLILDPLEVTHNGGATEVPDVRLALETMVRLKKSRSDPDGGADR